MQRVMASPWVPYLKIVEKEYPQLPYTFSMDSLGGGWIKKTPPPFLNFIEAHIWMASFKRGEFNNTVGIEWNGFSPRDYKRNVAKTESLYREKPGYWKVILTTNITRIATEAKKVNQPLITTKCWSMVNYKDSPALTGTG